VSYRQRRGGGTPGPRSGHLFDDKSILTHTGNPYAAQKYRHPTEAIDWTPLRGYPPNSTVARQSRKVVLSQGSLEPNYG